MPHARGIPLPEREIAEFRDRSGALRQSATLPGAQLPQLLDAALAELDGAIDTAAALQAGLDRGVAGGPQTDASGGERRLLGAMFAGAPVPLRVQSRFKRRSAARTRSSLPFRSTVPRNDCTLRSTTANTRPL